MQITYDPKADVLAIGWREAQPGAGKDVAPDLFVECDGTGQPIGLELLNASKHVDGEPLSVALELLSPELTSAR
ncbi:MAG TPA: DUF2283 domain-containing protein [Chloroflexota bacterium]|jgi:uncharacterized protein YuzE